MRGYGSESLSILLRLELNRLPLVDYRFACLGAIGGYALAPASFVFATEA